MKERALAFGDGRALVGVLTEPAVPAPADRPAVVFLNAGVLHRIGPNRIHVRLARELARRGFASLRFDYSGLGDSGPRKGRASFHEAVAAEVKQALDVLAARGARRFVLAGICSGADDALRVATTEERIAGAVLIEPMARPGPGYLLYSYRRKLLNPLAWWRLLRGRSEIVETLRQRRRVPAPPATEETKAAPPEVVNVGAAPPSADTFVEQVTAALDRGTWLGFVYCSESPAYVNYRTLLRRRLRRTLAKGGAALQVIRDTDHVFTPLAAQDVLIRTAADWVMAVDRRSGAGRT